MSKGWEKWFFLCFRYILPSKILHRYSIVSMEYLWRTDGQAMEEPRGFGYVGTRINDSSTTCVAWWALRIITANFPRIIFSNIRIIFRWSSPSQSKSGWKLKINCSLRLTKLCKFFAEAHQAEASHVAERSVIFVELTLKQKTSS